MIVPRTAFHGPLGVSHLRAGCFGRADPREGGHARTRRSRARASAPSIVSGARAPSVKSRHRRFDRARATSRWQDWNVNAKTVRRILRAYEEEDDWVLIGGVDGNGDDARVATGGL